MAMRGVRLLPAAYALAACVLATACGESEAGVPWRQFALVAPPRGFVGQCQDSLRHTRTSSLTCRRAAARDEWLVRLDSAGNALMLARFTRLGQGQATVAADSIRRHMEPRLGPGEVCPVGYGHTWYKEGWNTYVIVQGGDSGAPGDTAVTLLVAAARGPQETPC